MTRGLFGMMPLPDLGMPGDRVQLRELADNHTRLVSGMCGTIRYVDSLGTRHVNWDDGTRLGVIPGVDRWRII